MDHEHQSSGPVVFHSRKQYKLVGRDGTEVEGTTNANDAHALPNGEHGIMLDDKYENQAELVHVPKRLHLGYFSTV